MECAITRDDAARMTAAAQTAEDGAHSAGMRHGEVDHGWPRRCKTRDGAEYYIRPIHADDTDRDRAFIKSLSESSRYNRMMGLSREPSAELLDHLVHVDYRRDMALIAVVGAGATETIIGVARYGGDPDRSEFAIAVADDWQARGVGSTLATLLFAYAKSHGVRRIFGIIFANNERMLKLAGYLRMTLRRSSNDDSVLEAWRTL